MKSAVVKKLIAAACAALVVLCAWQSAAGAQDASPSRAEAKRERVRELFVQRCARCHGRDGRGRTKLGEIVKAPDFTDAGWWKRDKSDARLRRSIAEGKGEMPDFAKRLTRPEINALAAYVREFAPRGRDGR